MNSDEKGCNEAGRCIIASKKDIGIDVDVKPLISCKPKEIKKCEVDIDVEFKIRPGNVVLVKAGEKQIHGCDKVCCYKAYLDLAIEPKLRHTKPAPTRMEADFEVAFDVQGHCIESTDQCASSSSRGDFTDEGCDCGKCGKFNRGYY